MAHFAGDSDAARTAAEEAVRLARQIRSPTPWRWPSPLGNALASSDPGRALAGVRGVHRLVEAGAGGPDRLQRGARRVGRLRASAGDPIGAPKRCAPPLRTPATANFTSFAGSLTACSRCRPARISRVRRTRWHHDPRRARSRRPRERRRAAGQEPGDGSRPGPARPRRLRARRRPRRGDGGR